MDIIDLLQFISQTFDRLQIQYMLAGSMAMNFYAVSRATRDIDMVVQLQEKDVDKFLECLENFYYNKKVIVQEINRKGMFNVIDNNSGFKIDIILLKDSEYTLKAFEHRRPYNDLGFDVYVTSLEDLIIAKIQWIQQIFSERQVNDVQMLLRNKNVNYEYINHWCNKLKLNTFNLFS